jgi:hypothetical protein
MRKTLLSLAALSVVFLMTGPAPGDNCANACGPAGIQFTPAIPLPDPSVYFISLPCCNPYITLSDVFNAMNAAGCTAASVTRLNPDQSSCTWTGPFSCDVCIDCGMAVRVTTAVPCPGGWAIPGAANCIGPLVDTCPVLQLEVDSFPTADQAGAAWVPTHY